MIVSTGVTYERVCIEAWLKLEQNPCVKKKSPVDPSFIVPNLALRSLITSMAKAQGMEIPLPPSPHTAHYLAERHFHEAEAASRSFVTVQKEHVYGSSGFGSGTGEEKQERGHGVGFGSGIEKEEEEFGLGFGSSGKEVEGNELGFRNAGTKENKRHGFGIPNRLESTKNDGFLNKDICYKSELGTNQSGGLGFGRNESQNIGRVGERAQIITNNKQMGRSTPPRDVMDDIKNESLKKSPNRDYASKNPWLDRSESDYGINSSVRGATSPWTSISEPSSHPSEPSSHPLASNGGIIPPSLVIRPSSYVPDDVPHQAFSVESLVLKLKDMDVEKQVEGVSKLRHLTRSGTESRLLLCNPSIIEALIPLLISQDSRIQVDATAALMNLSLEKQNKLKIVGEGALPSLVEVLTHGVHEARHHAAGAIFSLSVAEENRYPLGVLNTIPPLIDLLRSGPSEAKQDAALALYQLSLLQMNASKIVKLRAVPILLNLAKSEERPKLAYWSLHILHNVASISEGRASLLQLDAITDLVKVLASNKTEKRAQIHEQAASVLLVLSKGNSRFKFMAMQAGAPELLNSLAHSGTPRARTKALALLEIMKERSSEIEGCDSYLIMSRQYKQWNIGRSDEQPNSSAF